jgi:hypothetical protein
LNHFATRRRVVQARPREAAHRRTRRFAVWLSQPPLRGPSAWRMRILRASAGDWPLRPITKRAATPQAGGVASTGIAGGSATGGGAAEAETSWTPPPCGRRPLCPVREVVRQRFADTGNLGETYRSAIPYLRCGCAAGPVARWPEQVRPACKRRPGCGGLTAAGQWSRLTSATVPARWRCGEWACSSSSVPSPH